MKDLVKFLTGVPIEELIGKSSFGTAGARSMRERTPRDVADAIVDRVAEADGGRDAVAAQDREITIFEFPCREPIRRGRDGPRVLVIDDLIRAAADGETEAVEELIHRLVDPVTVYCRARLGKRSRADDVAQEVCLEALERLPSFPGDGDEFLRLIFQVAGSTVDDALRFTVPPVDPSLSADRFTWMVNTLAAPERDVIVLRIAAGFTSADTGRLLAMSPAEVRRLQHRVLAHLRAAGPELWDSLPADGYANSEGEAGEGPASRFTVVSGATPAEPRRSARQEDAGQGRARRTAHRAAAVDTGNLLVLAVAANARGLDELVRRLRGSPHVALVFPAIGAAEALRLLYSEDARLRARMESGLPIVDAVFADVDGLEPSWVQVARGTLVRPAPELVVVTEHAEEAADTLGRVAIDYVIKPYQQDRVDGAVNRVVETLEAPNSAIPTSVNVRINDAG